MKKTLILTLLLAMAAGMTLGCCGKMMERAMEEAIEQEGGGDVDLDIGGLTGGGKPPKDLPKELVYPGSKATFSLSGGEEGETGGMASFETSASVEKVKEYYEGLESKGWKSEGVMETSSDEGESYMVTLSKGDFSDLITIAEGEDGKTAIGMIYGEGENTE